MTDPRLLLGGEDAEESRNQNLESEEFKMAYVTPLDGYIADVPEIIFKRCDSEIFVFDQVSTASFTPTNNMIEITGGQGLYPLAFIPSSSTLEASFTSAQFSMDMFDMANDVTTESKAWSVYDTGLFEVGSDLTFTMAKLAESGTTYIRNLAEDTALGTGKYTVTVVPTSGTIGPRSKIAFYTGDVVSGDTVRVTYSVSETATVGEVLTTGSAARGELTMRWPVYSAGIDCTEAAVKGWVVVHIFRCRVSALPGFDTSYKTAMTNGVTFSTMDPRRPGEELWEYGYIANS